MDLNSTQEGNCLKNVFLYADYPLCHVIFVLLGVLSCWVSCPEGIMGEKKEKKIQPEKFWHVLK